MRRPELVRELVSDTVVGRVEVEQEVARFTGAVWWCVLVDGRVVERHETRDEAVAAAREIVAWNAPEMREAAAYILDRCPRSREVTR